VNRTEFSGGWLTWILRGHRRDLKLSVIGGFRLGKALGVLIDTYWADSNGRRNTLEEEVVMSIRKRRSDRSGRSPLPSPGRPPVVGRDEQRRFWLAIARGMSSEDAAIEAGVSQPVGYRWFRKAGGMPPAMFRSSAKPLSGRYLSLLEREEIACRA
jgi:hypothetical protein